MRYEFQCEKHGAFEQEQKMQADHTADCPHCGQPAKRIYAPFRISWAFAIFHEDGSLQEK